MKNSYLTILILASAILGAHGDTNPPGYIHTNGMNVVVRSPSFAYTNHTTRLLSRSPSLLSARLNTSNRLASAAVSVRSVSQSAIQQIQVASDSARASFGLHKVGFAGSLGGAQPVSITTPDNHPLSFRPTLLAYYDTSSGQTVPLAEVQACGGAVQQPGLVVYANAFSNLDADVQYICTTNSLEQNIVLRQCPPAPDDFGLNPDTTRLEMWTEWFDTSPVRTQQSVITLNGGTNSTNAVTATDTALDFGTMKIVRGRAFNLDGVSNAVPVAKEWGEIQGRKFLLEAVDYRAIQPNLQTLTAAVTPSVKKTFASRGQIIKALSANAVKPDKGRMMQLASADAGQTKGVVLDFTIIDSIPLPEGAIEWWPADGDANDVVGGNNGTMMNGATFGAGEVGQGFSVDGVSSFVEIPSSTDPTGPFTIEFWMEADPNNQMDTIQGLIVNDFYGIEISSGWGGNNGANFFISPDGGSTWNMTSTPNGGGAVISSGDWHHIAGTYDGTNMQLYVDGQAWGDSCPSGPPSSTTTGDFLAFGSEDGTWRSDRYFDGILDEVTIYNRALSPSEIAAIYNAGGAGKDRPDCVAPPSNAIGWWAGDGNADDLVSTNNGTLQGGASYGSCEVGQGFVLDGSSGYVNVPDNDLWAFGNNDFTIELWANFANDPSGDEGHPYNGGIFISSDEGGGNANKWFFSAAGDVLNFHINDPVNGPIFLINSAFTPDLNTWYHLAVTRSGDTFTAYVNGVAAGSDTCARAIPNAAAPLMIGQAEGFYFNGSLDEVTIYNRALSDSEISAIYSAGGAGKCKTMSPFITVQPVNETVLQGSNATFSVMAGGSMPLSYQWYGVNCGQLTGATNATLTFMGVQAGNDDNYYVVVANAFGSVNSSSATLTVLVPPVITSQPTNQMDIQGSNAAFSVTATGTAPLSYQWWFNGTNLLVWATNSAMTLTNVQTTNAGNYYVIATNVVGSVTSSIVTLTVLVPPVITQQPTNQTVIQEGNVTNSVMVSGSTPLSYQWWFNGTNLLVWATNSAMTLTNVQPAVAGNYSVVITNLAGSVTSSNAVLTVLVPPTIITQPANQTVIQGGNVTNSMMASGSTPLSYQWWLNGTSLFRATNAVLILANVQPTSAGNYWVVVTNAAGSVTSSNALLTVLVSPVIIQQPANQTVIQGGSVTNAVMVSGSTPLSYQWWFDGTNLLSGATNSAMTLTNVQPTVAGNYSVVITNLAGSVTSSNAMLTVLVPPTITAQPTNQLVFPGSNAVFSVTVTGSAPLSYQWVFNGINWAGATNAALNLTNIQVSNFGIYSVIITNLAGGVVSSNASLSLLGPPLIVQQPANQVVPPLSNITFTVQATGTAPLSYQWLKNGTALTNGGTISGAKTNVLTLAGLNPWDQGLYSVIATNSFGMVISHYAIRVLATSVAFGWGDNTYGQITGQCGLYNMASVAIQNYYSLAVDACGNVHGSGQMQGCKYASATLNGISGKYTSGDALAPGASLMINNNIAGCILAAVDGNNNPIIMWPPAPVAAQPAQQFTLSFSNSGYYSTSAFGCTGGTYVYYGGGYVVGGGENISIGGVSVHVDGVGTGANGVVSSLTLEPNQDSTYGQTISGSVSVNSHTVPQFCTTCSYSTMCNGTLYYYSNVSSQSGSVNYVSSSQQTYPHGYISAQPNYFTLMLSQTFMGRIGDTLQIGSALMTVTATNGNAVTCQMQNTNVQGQNIPFIFSSSTVPTSSQIVMDNSANGSLVTVTTYPLIDGSTLVPNANTNYPIAPFMPFPNSSIPAGCLVPAFSTNVIQSNSIVQIVNPNGAVGNGDLLFVSAVNISTNVVGPVNIPSDVTNVMAVSASPNSIGWDDFSLALKNNGTVEAWDLTGPLPLPSGLTNIVAVAAGDRHCVALNASGRVIAWGDNTYGQTNVPANLTNAIAIAASTEYSLALRSNGTVVAWGYNIQTNLPQNLTNVMAIAAGYYHALALKTNGTVVAWNAWSSGVPAVTNVPSNLSNVVAIAAGNGFSLALKTNGAVVAWGANIATNLPSYLTNAATLTAGYDDSLAIAIPIPPAISQQPANYTTNQGGNAYFSIMATSMAPLSYQWLFNGSALSGATNAYLTVANVQAGNAGAYSVVVTNIAGSVTSSSATLTVLLAPIITQQPANCATNVGSNVTFTVTVSPSSATPLSYQWLFNGTNLAGATSATLTLNNVQTNNAGMYSVVVTNIVGSVTSSNAIFVLLPPVSWFVQYWGQNYQTNSNANPYADSTGDGLSNIGSYQAGLNPTNFVNLLLGSWRFNATNWIGDQGQLPLNQFGLASALVPGVEQNAVDLTGNVGSKLLNYRFAEPNGNQNIMLNSGSVIFWFRPAWSGINEGGTGPGSSGRLINIGIWTANAANGVWMIYLDSSGDSIGIESQDGAGNDVTISNIPISGAMISNQWIQIAVTYSPTNAAFYTNGILAGSGGGLTNNAPPLSILNSGLDIGTDINASQMAQGAFDWLQTFNYQLTAAQIQTNFQTTLTWDPNANPAGDGISNAMKQSLGLNPLMNVTAQSGMRNNYNYDLSDWLNGVSGIKSGSINLDNEGNVNQVSQ